MTVPRPDHLLKGSRVTDSHAAPATPPGRTPGKYIVWIIAAFGAVFLGFIMLLALKLDPAADRFHKEHPPPGKKG